MQAMNFALPIQPAHYQARLKVSDAPGILTIDLSHVSHTQPYQSHLPTLQRLTCFRLTLLRALHTRHEPGEDDVQIWGIPERLYDEARMP